jgi:hypothetical protein
MGFVHSRQITSGTSGRRSANGACHNGFAAAAAGVSRAPSLIQVRIVSISPGESGVRPSGICGGTSPVIRRTSMLSSELPG